MKKRMLATMLAGASLAAGVAVPAALASGPDRGDADRAAVEGGAPAKMWEAWTQRLDKLAVAYADRRAMAYRPPAGRP